ncbi:uncharacterized protein LOC131241176 [Magnolia sinica]|uniref:uncharacterized protein LOC131241176 n=1 Tax=Magnolia sinica TaxID=86752 RepID=UPI00265942CD|nr:uncharacterized protein LOC131241176 [Magnolia sinica]
MMEEKEVSIPCRSFSEERDESIYPMYFGVSCAFVALHLLSTEKRPTTNDGRWTTIADRMLLGSAQLVGLLVWKAQGGEVMDGRSDLLDKLKKSENEVAELKIRRSEDAKANEKVVGIFASQEQSWFCERKRLRQQIQALLDALRNLEVKKEESILNLKEKAEEKELLIQAKVEAMAEEEKKRKELEEKLRMAEEVAEELRETAKKEKQVHSSELCKHKTAFIELVSNQRQLEAEMGRALWQADATKQDLDEVLEQKEESVLLVEKLSMEIIKMQKDAEQKDKILSAMMRKSKLDMAEKQMLLKEVKISKARRKQAELETERWMGRCESRHDKHLRSNLANRSQPWLEMKGLQSFEAGCSQNRRMELQPTDSGLNHKSLLLECSSEAKHGKEVECVAQKRVNNSTLDCLSRYSPEENGEPVITANAEQLEDWVRMETEKYISILEQRHSAEIDAFAEQMRLKDEKLEAYHWRLLSMELESKRLQSHIEGLEENLSQFREENMKLEAFLLNGEAELKSLKEKFSIHAQHFQSGNSTSFLKSQAIVPAWSEVKIIKKKPRDKEQEQTATLTQMALQRERERKHKEVIDIDTMRVTPTSDPLMDNATGGVHNQSVEEFDRSENPIEDQSQDTNLTFQAPEEEVNEEKVVGVDLGHAQEENVENDPQEEAEVVEKSVSAENCVVRKDPSWKMDIHALGVSYKIKRLKQQLLMLEKLATTAAAKKPASKDNVADMPECYEQRKTDDEHGPKMKGFLLVMSLLNKQVKRYQSLEEKADDLCKRMHENNQEGNKRDSSISRTKGHNKTLEHFLEETFQVQRYMVATGQKLVEIQSKISSSFEVSPPDSVHISAGFDTRQFADCIRTLFREIQRGLEVRIARIIGDLEGTLTCEGILQLRN